MDGVLHGTIGSDWSEIETARTSCVGFLHREQVPKESIDAIEMVIGELLENALKYALLPPGARIDYSVTHAGNDILIEVRNPIDPGDERHYNRLDTMIQWIRGYQNPFEAFMEKLKEVAARPLDDRESGIGLVRIAYEGQSILDFFVNGTTIAVSAIHHLPSAHNQEHRHDEQ